MITIGYCTRVSNENFGKHLIKSCGLGDKKVEIIEIVNTGDKSLTECYNKILKTAKYDYVVFTHSDLTIETKQWGKKILKIFNKNQEFGIIGVAGTKTMPSSGMWWENPKKMYGKVKHTHNGKTWLSSYSEDLGDVIEETTIVDGVFFCIDKNKIKKSFDEDFKGFHFYDISFCFENLINGVKIGVTTLIRVNHKSIGLTNEAWDNNRKLFIEKYSNKLPFNIKRVLRKNEKLRVLIGCLSFANLTGSEIYVYELAKELSKNGCDVTICSTIGEPLSKMIKPFGVKLASLKEPPGFKLGDGKWLLKTSDGKTVKSAPNTLYKVSDVNFDVLHLNHKPVSEHLIKLYPNTPTISTIHSEIIALEEPLIHDSIKKYIAIRPEIKNVLVDKYKIDEALISVIYNPVDSSRFKPLKNNKIFNRVLFVGTLDYLRIKTIIEVINQAKKEGKEVYLVGKNNGIDINSILSVNPHVKYFPQTSNIEKFIYECDETAGILLGRTTIESWMCGKKSWIYNVDDSGNILSKHLYDVPDDINKFNSDYVCRLIKEEYLKII